METNSSSIEIQLNKSLLRPWEAGDEQSLVENANNFNVSKNLRDSFPFPYALEDANDWIAFNLLKKQLTNFAVVVDGKAVGGVGLQPKEDVFRKNMEIGYWLGEEYWSKGIISEAVVAVTSYGFKTFDIERIYAGVFSGNFASMRVLEKAGYIKEAVLKRSVFKGDKILDEHIYACYSK